MTPAKRVGGNGKGDNVPRERQSQTLTQFYARARGHVLQTHTLVDLRVSVLPARCCYLCNRR